MKRMIVPVVLALFAAACMTPADDRARRDTEIGKAESGGARIEVAEGLAAVHSFAPGEAVLWAGAPSLTITLVAPSPTVWSLTIKNLLADAVLTANAADGTPLTVTMDEERLPTEKRWSIPAVPAASTVTLRLTPPDVDDLSPWRFGAFADVQDAIDDVGDIYARMALDPSLRFVMMSGDLTEQGSRAQLERFMRELERLPIPCYSTLGNHELGERDDLFHDYYGRGNFRFVHRGVQFTLLDSASATLAPAVYDWLADWLAEGMDRFHVVFMHIPPLDPIGTRNGGFASRAEAHALLGQLARAEVDLEIFGHLHSYYASESAGVPTYISGGGGAIPEHFDGIGRHYLAIDVDPVTQRFESSVIRID